MRTRYVYRDGRWVNQKTGKPDRKRAKVLGLAGSVGVAGGGSGYPQWNPWVGVHTSQIQQKVAEYAAKGVQVEFHPVTGAMRVRDRQHFNQVLKADGKRNLDAGYGDWAGRN